MRGALVPHAPLLVSKVTAQTEVVRDVLEGIARIEVPPGATLVVVSPYADETFIYAAAEGSLASFGVSDVAARFATGAGVRARLAELMQAPIEDRPLDHGALVALTLLGVSNEVVVVGVSDVSDAAGVSRALGVLAADTEVFVVVSANTSARLTERAPLPYSYDAVRLESRLIAELETDCKVATMMATELAEVGGSRSAPTLAVFGELFAGVRGDVLAYGSPFGVGYLVATAETDV